MLLKEEQLDFSNQYPTKSLSTIHPSGSGIFLINDVTDDVHHIQTSLDNIRDFMFDNLPDATTIDDLFGDDPVLLSPLLQTNTDTTNLLTDNYQSTKVEDQYLYPNQPSSCKQLMLHKTNNPTEARVDIDHQLLEQLINETTKIEEQQKLINNNNNNSSLQTEKQDSIYQQTNSKN